MDTSLLPPDVLKQYEDLRYRQGVAAKKLGNSNTGPSAESLYAELGRQMVTLVRPYWPGYQHLRKSYTGG